MENKKKKYPGVRKVGKYWHIYYNVNGRQFKESSRSTKQMDAVRLRAKRVTDSQRGLVPRMEKLSAVLDDMLEEAELRQLRSIRDVRRHAELIREKLGHMPACNVTAATVREFRRFLRGRGTSNATVNRYMETLHRALSLALKSETIMRIPPFPDKLPEAEPRQGFFDVKAFDAIFAALPAWAADVYEFAYWTGWRRMEIFELTWNEVGARGRVIRLPASRSKNKRPREKPIGADILPVMKRRFAERIVGVEYVFHRNGTKIAETTWYRTWRKACKAAGYPDAMLHDCRRTAVRNLLAAGVPEKDAMELTGHVTRSVFDRYNIRSTADKFAAAGRLRAYIEENRDESLREKLSLEKDLYNGLHADALERDLYESPSEDLFGLTG